MKRFITVSLALFLGLITAQELAEPVFLQQASNPPPVSKDAGAPKASNDAGAPKQSTSDKVVAKFEDINEDLQRLNCILYDDLTFFDIRALEKFNPYTSEDAEDNIVASPNDSINYYINFCKRFILNDANGKEIKTFAYSSTLAGRKILTDSGKPSYTETVLQDKDKKDDSGDSTHIKFDQDGGEECKVLVGKEMQTKNFKVTYEIYCDASVTDKPSLSVSNKDPCNPIVTFSHKTGCPVFQATSIVRFLANNPIIMGLILIIFGIITTFFGGKFFKYVLATVSGGLTFLIVLLLASVVGALKALEKNRDATPGQISLTIMSFVVAIAAGFFVGWFIKKLRRIGITVLCAASGFFLGFLLYSLVFIQWLEHQAVLISLVIILTALGAYLGWRFDKLIIVYVTAFLGAYALIRGISIFAGKFPNEIALYGQLSSGTFEGLGGAFYGYLAGIVITGILGVIVQHKLGYHEHHDDEEYQKQ